MELLTSLFFSHSPPAWHSSNAVLFMFRVNYAEAVRLLHKFIINDDCNESIITVNVNVFLLHNHIFIDYAIVYCRADIKFSENQRKQLLTLLQLNRVLFHSKTYHSIFLYFIITQRWILMLCDKNSIYAQLLIKVY